jgi:Uma2 family endonuclease
MTVHSAPQPQPLQLAPAIPTELIYRLTVEQYHAMIRRGILNENDPVELLEGWLILKNPPAAARGPDQTPLTSAADVPTEPVYRLSVSQYHAMIEHGILTEDDPVELLEGWLVFKMSKNPPHRIATKKLLRALERVVPTGWYVDSQEPITTSDSEPEPDVMVARGDTVDYPDRHPGPHDTAVVIEVADASLNRDRTIKKRAYARAGVPAYWIVNLIERVVEVHTDPTGAVDRPDYKTRRSFAENDSLVLVVEGQELDPIPVRDILP